jgi:hypothetical protein
LHVRSIEDPEYPNAEQGETALVDELVGNEEHRWEAPDRSRHCTFGRARGMISLRIARVLGPMQSNNPVLDLYYKAVAGIRTWNGQAVVEPMIDMHFEAAFSRFGSDENLNDYVNTWQMALYPDMVEALKEIAKMGLGPEAVARVAENAGKQTSKKSRTARGSGKS